jgi:cytidine deaminase
MSSLGEFVSSGFVSPKTEQEVRVPTEINKAWRAAVKVRNNAYAPYSKFQVGATVVDERGRQFHGCNVENASYGATICAERNAVLQAIASGAKEIRDVVVVTKMNPPAEPCALCLQVLAEFASPEARVWMGDLRAIREVTGVSLLLPRHFGPKALKRGLRTRTKRQKR